MSKMPPKRTFRERYEAFAASVGYGKRIPNNKGPKVLPSPQYMRRIMAKRFAFSFVVLGPLIGFVLWPSYVRWSAHGTLARDPEELDEAAKKADGTYRGLRYHVLRAMNREAKAMMDIRSTYGEKGRKKQVALFVGATSGLGLETMKKWIYLLGEEGGKIYFVGRNKEVGEEIIEDFRRHHAHVPVTFIHSPDLSLLSESARVADIVASQESHLNLIVLSQGELDLSDAPILTPEGLDRKLSLNVYSRYLIIRRLIPLLLKSYEYEQSTEVNRRAMAFSPPRVISIFSPGFEGPVNEEDLSLSKPENYSMKQCIMQSAAMNSLMMEQLSSMYPGLGWIHVYPGIVRTNITRNMPEWIRTTFPVVGLFVAEKATEVKEGIAYLATRKRAGLQLVDWHGMSWDSREGESHGNLWDVGLGKYLGTGRKWWREGLAEKIWQHQKEVEKRVLGEQ